MQKVTLSQKNKILKIRKTCGPIGKHALSEIYKILTYIFKDVSIFLCKINSYGLFQHYKHYITCFMYIYVYNVVEHYFTEYSL